MKPVRVCLVGVSGYGDVHYRALLRHAALGRVRLVGATVINATEEAEKCARLQALGCRVFSNFADMVGALAHQADVCFIPTGIHLHAPMTIAAVQAGWHVLVEKPAAATIQQVRAMEAAARAAGRFVAVGFQSMYAAETLWMKQQLLDGAIGTVRVLKCRGQWPRLDAYYSRNPWAGRLRLGEEWVLDSPFHNAFAHQLNLLCFLAGTDLHQSAALHSVEAELYRARNIESADTACLRIITRQQVPLLLYVSHVAASKLDPELIVRGDRGELRWTMTEITLRRADGSVETRPFPEEEWDLRDALVRAVCARVQDPATFICDLAIAGQQTLAANAAQESAPVVPFPAELIQRRPEQKSTRVIVTGLDDAIAAAFAAEKLFHELPVPWARRGTPINVEHYEQFPQGPLPA